jgi:hypothetical protein
MLSVDYQTSTINTPDPPKLEVGNHNEDTRKAWSDADFIKHWILV